LARVAGTALVPASANIVTPMPAQLLADGEVRLTGHARDAYLHVRDACGRRVAVEQGRAGAAARGVTEVYLSVRNVAVRIRIPPAELVAGLIT
jgi:hypothetical protein